MRNDDGSMDIELSREFRSPNAARDHALEELQSNPDIYEKVVLMEVLAVLVNTGKDANPEFVRTGPEYVRRNGNGQDHNQIGYAGAPSVA